MNQQSKHKDKGGTMAGPSIEHQLPAWPSSMPLLRAR